MVKRGWTQLIIKDELAHRIRGRLGQEYRDKPRSPELSTYVQDLLWNIIEADEILRRYGPFLEELSVEPDKMFIKDNQTGRIAELTLRDGQLYCDIDESFNCVHVGFAWAIPKVYKAMDLHDKKMPEIHRTVSGKKEA